MTRAKKILVVAAALLGSMTALRPAAADEAAKSDADKLFEAVAAYDFGQDEKPLIAVTELVRRSYKDPKQREEIEARLVKLLESGTPACKRFVCRELWMAGSARCVPAVAKLLADEELSDAARYALERMADPAAAAALRDAVSKSKGAILVGVVDSLGSRRDQDTAVPLVPLLADKDPAVAAAAAWSLGRIGGTQAANALSAARAKADDKLRRVLNDACLLCADRLAADGKKDEAMALYKSLTAPELPDYVRLAATRGLLAAGGKKE